MDHGITGLTRIDALSYWRFTRLKNCQLSGAFSSSVQTNFKPSLLTGKAQMLGTLFHSIVETFHSLRSKGEIRGEERRHAFNEIVDFFAMEVAKNTANRHFGDPRLWPELAVLYQNLCDLIERDRATSAGKNVEAVTEKRLYSRDRLLFGEIDAFFVHPEGIDLVDYKSGGMTENDLPKESYRNQLLFYAYLIHQDTGIYPRSLSLVGKDSTTVSIRPSSEDSAALANEMRSVLFRYNDQVTKGRPISGFTNPSPENCLFCEVKASCESFWKSAHLLEIPPWAHIAIGVQKERLVQSRSGWISLDLTVERSTVGIPSLKVVRLFGARYPQLKDVVGQRLLLTNLRLVQKGNCGLVEVTDRSELKALGGAIGS